MVCSMHNARKHRHGDYNINLKDGRSQHLLYGRWRAMVERCTKPYSQAWSDYGGRGIKVCDRWLGKDGFNNYISDIGDPPSPDHTVDRIDNDGDYEPYNIRWALMDVQVHNQRVKSATGYRGVYKFRGKYRASIIRGEKRLYKGGFDTAEEAYKEYLIMESSLYGS